MACSPRSPAGRFPPALATLTALSAIAVLAPSAAGATPVAPVRTLHATVKPAYEDVFTSWTVTFQDHDLDFLISEDEIQTFSGLTLLAANRVLDVLRDTPSWPDVADGGFLDASNRPAWGLIETGGGGGSAPASRFTYTLGTGGGGGGGAEVPLPAPAALLAGGIAAMAALRRRRS